MGAEGNCGPQGTKEGGEGKAGKSQCNTWIEKGHPKFVDDGGQGFIVGRVWSQCDRQLTRHTVKVSLEREFHGRFTAEGQVFGGGGFVTCNEIPGERSIPCERRYVGCITGKWRVNFKVEWAGDGGALGPQSGTFEPDDAEMGWTEIVKCPGPRQGG